MQPLELIKNYTNEAISCSIEDLSKVIQKYIPSRMDFHMSHPINTLHVPEEIVEMFWKPLKQAFTGLKRIEHITVDGNCVFDKKTWVSSTGYYVGNFTHSLFHIPANRTSASLRFGEYYCIVNGKIVEAYVLFDYLQLMEQTGISLLPPTLGSTENVPPPQTFDGLQYQSADSQKSKQSMTLVMSMLAELLGDRKTSSKQKKYWSDDMVWYGPAGIGTFRGLKSFALYRNAFLNTFPDRDYGNHKGVISKNNYVSVVGWRSVHAIHQGSGWFGLAPTGKKIVLRVMDIWRVKKDHIQENWVLIDIPDFFRQLGIDIFQNIRHFYEKVPFEVPAHSSQKSVIDDPEEEQFKKFLKTFIKKT